MVTLAGASSSFASGMPRSVIADSRLTMVEVGVRQGPGDRPERVARVPEQRGEMRFEVHVPGEGQRDRAPGTGGLRRARQRPVSLWGGDRGLLGLGDGHRLRRAAAGAEQQDGSSQDGSGPVDPGGVDRVHD